MATALKLISHKLCPYVQRAVIALTEKGVEFERIDIDLADKPDWFLKLSPLGKTPVLLVGDTAIFESAVILEYLEETQPRPLHPANAPTRAEHRGWIEFGSTILNDIAGFYAAKDEATFKAKTIQLEQRFARLEARVAASPWFDGAGFSLVDAVFGPVFPNIARCRKNLAERPSVRNAVSADYPALLRDFIDRRNSFLSGLQAQARAAA